MKRKTEVKYGFKHKINVQFERKKNNFKAFVSI